jgi:hypothetical protein
MEDLYNCDVIPNHEMAHNRNLKEFSDMIMQKSSDSIHLIAHGWEILEKKPKNPVANNYKTFAKNYPSRIKPKAQVSEVMDSGVGQSTMFQPKFNASGNESRNIGIIK